MSADKGRQLQSRARHVRERQRGVADADGATSVHDAVL